MCRNGSLLDALMLFCHISAFPVFVTPNPLPTYQRPVSVDTAYMLAEGGIGLYIWVDYHGTTGRDPAGSTNV
jgi:hypothetical protein